MTRACIISRSATAGSVSARPTDADRLIRQRLRRRAVAFAGRAIDNSEASFYVHVALWLVEERLIASARRPHARLAWHEAGLRPENRLWRFVPGVACNQMLSCHTFAPGSWSVSRAATGVLRPRNASVP